MKVVGGTNHLIFTLASTASIYVEKVYVPAEYGPQVSFKRSIGDIAVLKVSRSWRIW